VSVEGFIGKAYRMHDMAQDTGKTEKGKRRVYKRMNWIEGKTEVKPQENPLVGRLTGML
jgi:hypothetical protein